MAGSKRQYDDRNEYIGGGEMDDSIRAKWAALAEKLRVKLDQKAEKIPDMTAADIESLVDSIHGAMALAFKAEIWDKDLELHNAKTGFED